MCVVIKTDFRCFPSHLPLQHFDTTKNFFVVTHDVFQRYDPVRLLSSFYFSSCRARLYLTVSSFVYEQNDVRTLYESFIYFRHFSSYPRPGPQLNYIQ